MRKAVHYSKLISLMVVSTTAFIFSCSTDEDEESLGNWINRSVFDGSPRSGMSGFTIGNIGYMGVGYDGDDYLNSFWTYDIEGDFWSQKADFPGSARNAAVGFQIDGKGYIGSGYDGVDELNDFYTYDPSSNTWTQVASIESTKRRSAVAFSANGFGYFGTGYDGENDRKDFWKYDPSSDTWTEQVGFGGNKRRSATTFTINGLIYLGTGISNGIYLNDFWAFDPSNESWTKKTDLDEEGNYNIERSRAVGFSLNGYGYIACGEINGASTSVWEYDPATDMWEAKTNFEGSSRQDAVAFANTTRAFVGLGRSGSLYLDDLDEFFPLAEYDEED